MIAFVTGVRSIYFDAPSYQYQRAVNRALSCLTCVAVAFFPTTYTRRSCFLCHLEMPILLAACERYQSLRVIFKFFTTTYT